ncbi:hypothetical protein DA803_01735 [[Mycoplasma] phocae]|uniref:Uncharacterized protein n=1 Tax=[Mycoplasma] phocae TaxID=142651 RepID=A0A2Z5IQ22_9BACT|nr:GDSL-type esterase/lipase family protein [[Mycoplasma] phocae]AXE60805.1 hypothetical protein DA803_01735 [[Mycoplasma] phocae]
MKKNKLNKTIIGIGAFIVLGSSGIIAAACNSKKNNDEQIRVENNQKILSGKIKYLAIGDDYTAGNNYSKNNYVVNGFNEQTSQITGLSYASYLANAIKDLNDKKTSLDSYYNYGLSGSKLDDWLHILNSSKYPINTDIQNNIDYNKNLMNDANSSRLQEQFGNFDEEAFNKIRNKIKDANLLTISVGFNDFFSDVNLFNNLFEITNGTTNYEDLEAKLKSWSEKLIAKASPISQKYNALIKEILSINPNAHINLVGYISPYLKLANILKKQFNGKDYIYEAVKELNDLIKKVAKNNQINFVSFHDEESIISNPNKFSLDVFEMLPSLAAYKKLAQDIFMKLALDPFKYDELINNVNGDSDVSGFSQAILFEKKAEDIKQTILGITGDNTDNFINKKYPFENESQNSEILESQNSDQNANPLTTLKAKFNNGKGLDVEKTISYFELTINLLGIDLSELKLSFAELKNDLADEENRQVFANFIDQILSSEIVHKNINQIKTRSNEVIEKKSYENLKIKDITSIFKEAFLSPNSIYTFFKELSQTAFIKNSIIKNKFETYTELIIKDLFASNLIKTFLPTDVSENFETIFRSDEFRNSLKNVVNSFVSHLIAEPDKYSSTKNYTEFINLLLKDSSAEIKKLIAAFISILKNNPDLVETLLAKISRKIQSAYKLDEEKLQQVQKFIKIFMLNLTDFKYTDKLVDFALQTLIDLQNESAEKRTIEKFFDNFFSSILVDKYDSNKKHTLLFSLISANLGKNQQEQEDFKKGFEVFGLSYLSQQNLFDLNNLGKLVNEKNRDDILLLLLNLVKNENQELNENGKQFIANFTTTLIENEIQNSNSNLNVLLKQLSNYFIVNPVSLSLKTIFGEDIKINNESVENFVEKIWDDLWSQIKSQEIIDNLKTVISSILNRNSHYDTKSTHSFVASIIKDAKNNGIISLIDSLFKKILGSNELINNTVNGALSLIEQGAKTTFTEEQKKLASSYFTNLLANIPQSKLYTFAKAKLENTLEGIDSSKQKNFSELGNYIKGQMKELLSFQNSAITQEIIDIIFVKNQAGEAKMSFNDVIKSFALVFDNEKVIDFAINKFNFKNVISNLLTNAKLSNNLSEEAKGHIKKILGVLNTFINDKFESEILAFLKSSIKDFFTLNKNGKEFNSLDKILKEFISKNKDKLKTETAKLIKSLVESEGGTLKLDIAKLITTLISDNVEGFNWNNGKEILEGTIVKLIDVLPNLGLTNIILNFVFDNLETNLVEHQFDVDKYTFSIKFADIINGLNYSNLISFITKLNSSEIKNIALLALKNLKHILKSRALPAKVETSRSTIGNVTKKFKLSFKGDITVSLEKWLDIFKKTFSILKGNDKEEVKNELEKEVDDLFNNEEAKAFLKVKLSSIIDRIVKKGTFTNKVLGKLFETFVNGVFEGDKQKTLIKHVSEWFIKLDETKLNTFKSINDITKMFLSDNQKEIVDSLNDIFEKQIGNRDNVKELISFGLNVLTEEYGFTATNTQENNIKSLLSKFITKFSDTKILSDAVSKLFDVIKEINIFNENKWNKDKLLEKVKKNVEKIKLEEIFSEEKIEQLLSSIITNDEEITTQQLFSIYEYLKENLPKLKSPLKVKAVADDEIANVQSLNKSSLISEFKSKIEKIIVNLINALNKTLKGNDTKVENFKKTITNTLNKVIVDQTENFDYSKLANKFISTKSIKTLILKISKYEDVNNLFKNLIKDFVDKYDGKENDLGKIISSIINYSKNDITTILDSIISKIVNDSELMKILIKDLFNYLSINGDDNDVIFIQNLIKKIVNKLNGSSFKTRIIENIFNNLEQNSNLFDIFNPSLWINQAVKNIGSIISLNDLAALDDLIGEDNDKINGSDIVKLINLILGKSNNPDSFVYNSLSNINMNSDPNARTNLETLNNFVIGGANKQKKSAPKFVAENSTKKLDPLDLLNKIFELLSKEIEKEAKDNPDYKTNYKVRYNKNAYKATYRFIVTLKLAIFEMFGRETLESNRDAGFKIGLYSSTVAILWVLQEGLPGFAQIFLPNKNVGMQNYFKDENIRREFTNYAKSSSIFGYTYFDESNYDPSSIDYLIVTSGYHSSEQEKLTPFKYKVTKDGKEKTISKKDYILLTIKEGGFAKFMKINNAKSGSKWSELNKFDFQSLED